MGMGVAPALSGFFLASRGYFLKIASKVFPQLPPSFRMWLGFGSDVARMSLGRFFGCGRLEN